MFLCICFLICLRMQVASSAKGVPSTGGLGGGFEICVNWIYWSLIVPRVLAYLLAVPDFPDSRQYIDAYMCECEDVWCQNCCKAFFLLFLFPPILLILRTLLPKCTNTVFENECSQFKNNVLVYFSLCRYSHVVLLDSRIAGIAIWELSQEATATEILGKVY